jgi:hypothetical protein
MIEMTIKGKKPMPNRIIGDPVGGIVIDKK